MTPGVQGLHRDGDAAGLHRPLARPPLFPSSPLLTERTRFLPPQPIHSFPLPLTPTPLTPIAPCSRTLYGRWLEHAPANCGAWVRFAGLEASLGEASLLQKAFFIFKNYIEFWARGLFVAKLSTSILNLKSQISNLKSQISTLNPSGRPSARVRCLSWRWGSRRWTCPRRAAAFYSLHLLPAFYSLHLLPAFYAASILSRRWTCPRRAAAFYYCM